MTTPRGAETANYPCQNSVVITISECNPNSGGGNRTNSVSVEEKRRKATLVVVRSMDSSMLSNGTLKSALAAVAEKLKGWNDEDAGGDYEILKRQDRYNIDGSPFDVAVALDWKSYHRHVFGEESVRVRQKRKKNFDGGSKKKEQKRSGREEQDGNFETALSKVPDPQSLVKSGKSVTLNQSSFEISVPPAAMLSFSHMNPYVSHGYTGVVGRGISAQATSWAGRSGRSRFGLSDVGTGRDSQRASEKKEAVSLEVVATPALKQVGKDNVVVDSRNLEK